MSRRKLASQTNQVPRRSRPQRSDHVWASDAPTSFRPPSTERFPTWRRHRWRYRRRRRERCPVRRRSPDSCCRRRGQDDRCGLPQPKRAPAGWPARLAGNRAITFRPVPAVRSMPTVAEAFTPSIGKAHLQRPVIQLGLDLGQIFAGVTKHLEGNFVADRNRPMLTLACDASRSKRIN